MSKINVKKDLAFVILIGGLSARFGSDKGIFEFLGKPLISYQIETLSKYNHPIFLVANSQEQVQEYINKIDIKKIMAFILDDMEIIEDDSLRTPMIGAYSAFKELNKLEYEKAFVFSCDAPLIKFDIVELLIKKSEGFDCCIPKWDNGFLEPLFAIYSVKDALLKAKESLENKTYKLLNLFDANWKINYISVENDIKPLDRELTSFININGPIDIEKLLNYHQLKKADS